MLEFVIRLVQYRHDHINNKIIHLNQTLYNTGR